MKNHLAASLSFVIAVSAGSLQDIKHVVLFMQENRAFDHYFGTMPGVRGFADPNVQVNPDGRTTFQQPVSASESNATDQLTPWHLNYLGGHWVNATQCAGAGSNSWQAMHGAFNGGLNNDWVTTNTPYSWGFFTRDDIPVHFDIAEGWTVGDMYQEGIMAATDPNRVIWMSGTVNNPGTPSNPNGTEGYILDNSATPGCEFKNVNCFPFTWRTVPEYWQAAGVDWQLYQNPDNFEDNMLAYFAQYEKASKTSPLTTRGNSYVGLEKFFQDAANGTLPQVSYIVGPAELSEHPPYLPKDGAWLQKRVVEAVANSPAYNETVLIISYDEEGGWGDHVTPFHAPRGTAGEWIQDPYNLTGYTPVGPGYRLPFYIVSPWTRGGHVFTEPADHNSQIMFVEQWLESIGKTNVRSKEVPPWRRQHMSQLLNAFDFDNPDYSIPTIAATELPLRNPKAPKVKDGELGALSGNYIGAAKCESDYPTANPPVPYGKENAQADPSLLVEEGFKPVRGALTEGRYLTFETNGYALTNNGAKKIGGSKSTQDHESIAQRWVLHQVGNAVSKQFTISSAEDGLYLSGTSLVKSSKSAEVFTLLYSSSSGYSISKANGQSLTISKTGMVSYTSGHSFFSTYSVTYHS